MPQSLDVKSVFLKRPLTLLNISISGKLRLILGFQADIEGEKATIKEQAIVDTEKIRAIIW
jgi:hypothetical protein